jgi:muramoyltetrapeptide carboxypeptidase
MPGRDGRSTLRLLGIAGPCGDLPKSLGLDSTDELVRFVEDAIDGSMRVSANAALIEADEDPSDGGRHDDDARIAELNGVFGDDEVAAVVGLRGGAWLTRILDRVDFGLLDRRRRPIAIVGFSELTPLLNIAARHENAIVWHDITPGYILNARRYVARCALAAQGDPTPTGDAEDISPAEQEAIDGFPAEFKFCFVDLARMFRGRPSERRVLAAPTDNGVAIPGEITIVGGNLTTLIALPPSPFADALRPEGRWLLIEDIRESPNRIDRMLSHLSLSGQLRRFAGILVGDFQYERSRCAHAVVQILKKHLRDAGTPILMTGDVGHVWRCGPLPIGRQMSVTSDEGATVCLSPRWSELAVL